MFIPKLKNEHSSSSAVKFERRKQKYLNYYIRHPFKVIPQNIAGKMATSQRELQKTGFLYSSYKILDTQN